MTSSETAGVPAKLQCRFQRAADPCAIVLFGASGDLTAKKLMPALFGLFVHNYLPDDFYIVGCARSEFDDAAFRTKINQILNKGLHPTDKTNEFLKRIHYLRVEYDNHSSYDNISEKLKVLDSKFQVPGNRMFYLAVPPVLYTVISNNLGQSGLLSKNRAQTGWQRVIIEKPFGSNLETARELNACLKRFIHDEQIFRIDHYLAKETVQNILFFRFANIIFEPLWNSQYIDHVDILVSETIGIENRAGYYEKAGIIRDMFQNHMMQLLSLMAMEPPAKFTAQFIQDEKTKLFQSMRPFNINDPLHELVLGQYGRGSVRGEEVRAYRDEPGVDNQSITPTFAAFKLFIDNHRWKGVPFHLCAGKRLDSKQTRITVQFKALHHSIFDDVVCGGVTPNCLTFLIQPDEKISLSFEIKNPGPTFCPRTRNMEFTPEGKDGSLDAYEKVILDCLNGEQMLFLRQDAEELCWDYFTKLIDVCETCFDLKNKLVFYPAGTSPHEIR